MRNSSSETHDPFVVARLIGVPASTIVGVTRYGAATGEPWRFVTVELDDGTNAITCTDLVRLVDVGQRAIDHPKPAPLPQLLDQALQEQARIAPSEVGHYRAHGGVVAGFLIRDAIRSLLAEGGDQ